MPVGLEAYSNVGKTGYVGIDRNDKIKVTGDTPFFGKIVRLVFREQSKTDVEKREGNERTRQDLFDSLKGNKAYKAIAAKYEAQLIGDDVSSKPLSARLVHQIMTDVRSTQAQMLEKGLLALGHEKGQYQELTRGIVDRMCTLDPNDREGMEKIQDSLYQAVSNIGTKVGGIEKGKVVLAALLKDVYDELSPQDQKSFRAILKTPKDLVSSLSILRKEVKAREWEAPDRDGSVVRFNRNPVDERVIHNREGEPLKSILKGPKALAPDPDDLGNKALSEATVWLSEAQDKAMDGIQEKHFPQPFRDMIARFNDHLPEGRKITYESIVKCPLFDCNEGIIEAVAEDSGKGLNPLDGEGMDRSISKGIKDGLPFDKLMGELRKIDRDQTLDSHVKARAAYRLINTLGDELLQNSRVKDGTQRHVEYQAIIAENVKLARLE